MTNIHTPKNQGFTLIELLMVIALTALSIGITSDILISLTRGYTKTQVLNEIEQQSNFVSLKIQKELKNAVLISNPDVTTAVSGATEMATNWITLRNREDQYVTYYFKASTQNGFSVGKLYRAVDVTPPFAIPGDGIELTDAGLNNMGGVNVTCTGSDPDTSCFTVSISSPMVVSYNMRFTQSQLNPKKDYEGSLNVSDVVVIRNTYSVTRQVN